MPAHVCFVQVLSRQIAELGIYPAVDPLDSTSRMLDPRVIGDEHYETARSTQKLLQDYKGLQVSGGFERLEACGVKLFVFDCLPCCAVWKYLLVQTASTQNRRRREVLTLAIVILY